MKNTYNKLVRDKIPDIIEASGNQCEIATLCDRDYQEALRQKLMEEAREVATASPSELIKELADLYEVLDALITTTGISEEMILTEQRIRREERGGFQKKILLLSTLTR